ncbi:flagellar motor switch phosphatase FliY [Calorimonas adulescens]|jgi:flagellar motor switch protein FliN|uniref:Flagellar motor switch phosphatase FliY n=1 Tax=Calorimonas adulescens TaxID=2606906 RepID=A0A5D8QGQ4_9THEO|nr:flagellar motor switch phosphatase FliY [Calorimonas adulescens]
MVSDNILSQKEIDALLHGVSAVNSQSMESEVLTPFEIDVLGEIGNISMGTSATTLYTLLRNKVSITTPSVSIVTWEELKVNYPVPYVGILVEYTKGITGFNLLILEVKDVMIMTDLMMGGDGTNINGEIGDLQLSAVSEAMNQMIGSAATSLATILKKDINISPPKAFIVDFPSDVPGDLPLHQDKLVQISFDMVVGNLINSKIMQLMPIDFAKEIVSSLTPNTDEHTKDDEPIQKEDVKKTGAINDTEMKNTRGKVEVKPAIFQELSETPGAVTSNIDLIMDVPLDVTVELGRTRKTIKEILEIGTGSVIELDKIAGEPVDILVNGKIIAKGEVVVIDENFGVRITDIIKNDKNELINSYRNMEV